LQRFIIHVITEQKFQSSSTITEIEDAHAVALPPPADPDSINAQSSDDEVVEVPSPGNLTPLSPASQEW
jgi:hypothetical protein